MSTPMAVVTVNHPQGGPTTYGIAITTNGIDRQPVTSAPTFTTPKEACRYAERLDRRLSRENAA